MRRKTLAIPVRLVNFSDSSQVLTLFTREFGAVEAIAKGAHRERSPFQGPFDLAAVWEVVFAERAPERGLCILTEGTVVEGFRGLRRRYSSWTRAAFVIEYLRAVGTAGESAGALFDLAIATLRSLAGIEAGPGGEAVAARALLRFEARALRLLGLSAPAESCAECGRPWSRSDRPVFFSPPAGGILCGPCREKAPGRRGLVVPGGAVRAFEDLSRPDEAGLRPSPAGGLAGPGKRESFAALLWMLGELRVYLLEWKFATLKYLPALS